ncbi:HET-domain-containing protein, partial [Polyplosphaeria fusca]
NQVNFSLIRRWRRMCSQVHQDECEEPGKAAGRLGQIRVIDVEHMIVIRAPRHCRYIALTYVWGGPQEHQARKEQVRVGSSGVEYIPLPNNLPQTILDACTVSEALGERYLWVDSLCIVQNDDEERHDQIMRMDAIYSSAVLTIAAASGSHCKTGLPGVSAPRTYPQCTQKINEMLLAIPFPSLATLEQGNHLIWNSRGWT